ncbi:hypothetical protein PAXRUDRAFT_137515 [Paxillus rubicundulus Ve08.2h10]|uniref:Reverse transcriptase zinc-binding domain-containing protein n=1 Tax=Paxillus rubicundulus Ve08.2h10 TaxID=930991 RepID=A0A0D0E5Y5_9AGAM|nr:hypothetical protein PAXRUDRAFT_137515 [Paxillus rubicundulus Ve08.2h10]
MKASGAGKASVGKIQSKYIDEPSPKFLKLASSLPKHHISLIVWLRTAHIAFNKHLHHIKKSASPLFPYCDKIEMVEHYLTICPQYICKHHILSITLGRSMSSVPFLFRQPKAINLLIAYINSSGRMKETFSNVHPKPVK